MDSPEEIAKRILVSDIYMTLATADGSGVPWASPVYYVPSADRTELYWVSRAVTRHSRNLAVRPELAIVIFDSTVPVYTGQAVYNEAIGGIVPEEELERGMSVFAECLREDGEEWTVADVVAPASRGSTEPRSASGGSSTRIRTRATTASRCVWRSARPARGSASAPRASAIALVGDQALEFVSQLVRLPVMLDLAQRSDRGAAGGFLSSSRAIRERISTISSVFMALLSGDRFFAVSYTAVF